MLKARNNTGKNISLKLFMVIVMTAATVGSLCAQPARNTTTLYSADSLLLTVDDYMLSDTLPYLVLLHEQGASRGEYSGIIHRFQKMNFNCLVPDLRNGGNSSYITNETVKRSRRRNFGKKAADIEGDIHAAIAYAREKSGKPVVLIGAGANGSLALKTAKEVDAVRAAIALSPGEFFRDQFSVEDTIAGIEKPVLILSSRMEYPYMEQLLSKVDERYKELFVPELDEGRRGTSALTSENPSQSAYWLSILLFFKELQ